MIQVHVKVSIDEVSGKDANMNKVEKLELETHTTVLGRIVLKFRDTNIGVDARDLKEAVDRLQQGRQ